MAVCTVPEFCGHCTLSALANLASKGDQRLTLWYAQILWHSLHNKYIYQWDRIISKINFHIQMSFVISFGLHPRQCLDSLLIETWDPLSWHELTYINYKVWDEITYPFHNFNSAAIDVREWIINFIPPFIGYDSEFRCIHFDLRPQAHYKRNFLTNTKAQYINTFDQMVW